MTTHEFDDQASLAERRKVLRNDTYFSRQSNAADDAGGRFAKFTPVTITGSTPSPQYPSLPASSPWSQGFVSKRRLPFGVDVNALGTEQANIEPALSPTTVIASPADVGDRAEEPVADVATSSAASSAVGSSIKRRGY